MALQHYNPTGILDPCRTSPCWKLIELLSRLLVLPGKVTYLSIDVDGVDVSICLHLTSIARESLLEGTEKRQNEGGMKAQ
jgi:hypothetical protein